MMMKIGVRAHDYGRMGAAALARSIAEAGFEGAQLAMTKAISGIEQFSDITPAALEGAREAFGAAGVEISVMGCYQEIGAWDDAERREAVHRFVGGIGHAKALGAKLIATETTQFSGTDERRALAYAGLLDGALRIADEAERQGITACVEPVAVHTLHSAALARRLLDDVGSPRLKIVFDPVNLLTARNLAAQDAIWDEFFDLLGDDIMAVHLKDVDERLEWRNLGEGVVHYGRIFERLRALQRDIPLLREMARPDSAGRDIAAMKRWRNGA